MMGDKSEEENLPPCSDKQTIKAEKNSNCKVTEKYKLGDVSVPTFCVRFDYHDKYIAAGQGDGAIRIYNVFTGKCSFTLNDQMPEPMPTTSIR
jgi:WD40 repeat protein